MRIDKFTRKLQEAISDAQSIAVGRDNNFIMPQHLVLALLEQQGGTTAPLLSRMGVDVSLFVQDVKQSVDQLPTIRDTRVIFGCRLNWSN